MPHYGNRVQSKGASKGGQGHRKTSNRPSNNACGSNSRANDHRGPPVAPVASKEVAAKNEVDAHSLQEIEYPIPRSSTDPNAPTMPGLNLVHSGKKQMSLTTEIINLDLVAKRLSRDPEDILEFLGDKLDAHHYFRYAPGSVAGCRFFIQGIHKRAILQDHLDEYIRTAVLCPRCDPIKTLISQEDESDDTPSYCDDCTEFLK